MSYGLEAFGIGSFGGADFVVLDQNPIDGAIDINRLPTISFLLSSNSGDITLSSITLTANSIPLITAGVFTANATGIIDASNPSQVIVTAIVTHAFSPLSLVSVVVSAMNASSQTLVSGTSWSFTVGASIVVFNNYIIRAFERVFRVGS
jgi:hypothetical protein